MSILIVVPDRDVKPLRESIELLLPEVPVWVFPDLPQPQAVQLAILWKHPPGLLKRLNNLRLISSLGAGVEHILNDPDLPAGIPVVRMVDENITISMRNYVLMAILNIQKQFRFYQANQLAGVWQSPKLVNLPLRIGMLGIGALGGPIAQFLAAMGFEVWGYSQSQKSIEGVRCLSAEEVPLSAFASQVNVMVCLLPNTPETKNILNRGLFQAMPAGSYLINVARGAQLVEEDLLWALAEGLLQEAWLDVFREEPLPKNHAFWNHPKIVITPHIASVTNQVTAAGVIAENYRRSQVGESLLFEVDRAKAY
ncbi:MAG: glyoxylate/hydroxypyruvate reductase A [Saprospiraceae bacterium]|nr:MAG: glyoxylate/hydroxypyruvate reductase A [Saprospiraceae bacterium]